MEQKRASSGLTTQVEAPVALVKVKQTQQPAAEISAEVENSMPSSQRTNWWFLIMSIDYMILPTLFHGSLTERLYFAFDFDSVLSSSATARGGGTAASETWPDVKLSLKRFQNAKKSPPPPFVPRSNWQHKVQVPFLPSSFARSIRRLSKTRPSTTVRCHFAVRFLVIDTSFGLFASQALFFFSWMQPTSADCAWQISSISHACN